MPDAANGAARETRHKIGLLPRHEANKAGGIKTVARGEFRVASADVAVPGTNELAIVAAIDAVADGGAQCFRYKTREFDGEIGNAAAGVDFVRRDNRLGRAGA